MVEPEAGSIEFAAVTERVAVLDRERHEDLIEESRETGARIHIRPEGDLTPAIAVGNGTELPADLIRGGDVVFATGVTSGETMKGVRYFRGGGRTHTLVMSTGHRMIRFMDTIHALESGAGLRASSSKRPEKKQMSDVDVPEQERGRTA